jgi:hypothetical protein
LLWSFWEDVERRNRWILLQSDFWIRLRDYGFRPSSLCKDNVQILTD